MKVHNLTDVSTPALEGAGLCNVTIHVGKGVIVAPGEVVTVGVTAGIDRFLRNKALFVGEQPPEAYLLAKQAQADKKEEPKPEAVAKDEPAPKEEHRVEHKTEYRHKQK